MNKKLFELKDHLEIGNERIKHIFEIADMIIYRLDDSDENKELVLENINYLRYAFEL